MMCGRTFDGIISESQHASGLYSQGQIHDEREPDNLLLVVRMSRGILSNTAS
jgi:hypothetical protein